MLSGHDHQKETDLDQGHPNAADVILIVTPGDHQKRRNQNHPGKSTGQNLGQDPDLGQGQCLLKKLENLGQGQEVWSTMVMEKWNRKRKLLC